MFTKRRNIKDLGAINKKKEDARFSGSNKNDI